MAVHDAQHSPRTTGFAGRLPAVLGNALGLFLLVAVIGIGAQRLFGDSDPAMHVATGRFIIEQREVPRTDPFSATHAGKPWFAHEWLADLLWFGVFRAAGWPGLLVLAAVLIAGAQVLLYRELVRRGDDALIAFVAVTLTASVAAIHWLARPHLLTLLLLVIWVTVLEGVTRHGASARRLILLPPLMVLWANLHGGFLVGFVVLCAYLAAEVVDALVRRSAPSAVSALRLAVAGGIAALATLANPYGVALHRHLLAYFAAPRPGLARNAEFAPASLSDRAGISLLVLVAAGLVALGLHLWAVRRFPKEVRPPSLGAAFGFGVTAVMAVISIRHVAVTAVFAALLVGDGLSAVFAHERDTGATRPRIPRLRVFLAGCVVAALFACAGMPSGAGYSAERFPVATVRTLRASGSVPDGPVFALDRWGGYLVLEWPEAKVFVDGRSDMYGDEFFVRYARAYEAAPGWREVLDGAGVNLAILPRDAPLAIALANDARWQLGEADAASVVFRRRLATPRM